MKTNMMVSVLFLMLAYQVTSFESICRKLQVSTDIQLTKDDVIKDGVPIDKWNRNSRNSIKYD